MAEFLQGWLTNAPKLTLRAVVDIAAVAALIYQFILLVRGRRAANVLTGIGILVLVYVAAVALRLELLRTALSTLAPYSAFGLIVMFQSELRRALARLGRSRAFSLRSRLERRESFDEILLAVQQFAAQRTGALIVLERDIGLRTFIESGVMMDARLSSDLLSSIFMPGAALHDGAVIVQGDRVAAAACFLPLSTNPLLYRELGTRHRAAIGVTEETDCLAIVVSEETGRISLAAFSEIQIGVTTEVLSERLSLHLTGRHKPTREQPSPHAMVERREEAQADARD
jgi:diadenylate cyclase